MLARHRACPTTDWLLITQVSLGGIVYHHGEHLSEAWSHVVWYDVRFHLHCYSWNTINHRKLHRLADFSSWGDFMIPVYRGNPLQVIIKPMVWIYGTRLRRLEVVRCFRHSWLGFRLSRFIPMIISMFRTFQVYSCHVYSWYVYSPTSKQSWY